MQYLQFAAPQNLHVKETQGKSLVTCEWLTIVFWFYQCPCILVTLKAEGSQDHSSAKVNFWTSSNLVVFPDKR